jgi:DedD protein
MDPQLKERLIGAAVLIALAVWLIPLVLDGPAPVRETSPLTLELPLGEETPALRTQTIDLDDPRVDSPQPAPLTQTARNEAIESLPAGTPAAAPPEREPEPEPAHDDTPAVEPPQLSRPSVAATPSVQASLSEPEPAAPSGDWMVQLGSFGERENAERVAKRVGTFGAAPEVSTTRSGGRVMYRVRVGPHDSRDLAEAAASSLSAHGFVAQVVTID